MEKGYLIRMSLIQKLFRLDGKWKHINFNEKAAEIAINSEPSEDNPFLDPKICETLVKGLHVAEGIDYSYGGWMEDRSILWKGHYHKEGHTVHLGVDYNVPAGTKVHAPFDCTVIHSWVDPDQNGGWGGRLILDVGDKHFEMAFILGHLTHDLPKVGDKFKAGDVIGIVANYPDNGNWFPHLHVQCVDPMLLVLLPTDKWHTIDGYDKYDDELAKDYPDPELL